MMTTTIEARQLTAGDVFRYDGREYQVTKVDLAQNQGIDIFWKGGEYPMGFYMDSLVELLTDSRYREVEPKPYVVYTRLYKKNGDCEKKVHRFATRARQAAFVASTHRAVTYYN